MSFAEYQNLADHLVTFGKIQKIETNADKTVTITGVMHGDNDLAIVCKNVKDKTRSYKEGYDVVFLGVDYEQGIGYTAAAIDTFREFKQADFLAFKASITSWQQTTEQKIHDLEIEQAIQSLRDQKTQLSRDLEALKSEIDRFKSEIVDLQKLKNLEESTLKECRDELDITQKILVENHEQIEDGKYARKLMPRKTPENFSVYRPAKGLSLSNQSWLSVHSNLANRIGDEDFASAFLLSTFSSLLNGRFLLLAGDVGVGKSSLVEAFTKQVGGKYEFISVRPGWLDATDLLGYVNANNVFIEGPLTKRLKNKSSSDALSVVLLDEMNIARIENYASDILANLGKTEAQIDLGYSSETILVSDALKLAQLNLQQGYSSVKGCFTETEQSRIESLLSHEIPTSSMVGSDKLNIEGNIFMGTLNLDHTTETLSPKMIDRSFLLRFPSPERFETSHSDDEIVQLSRTMVAKMPRSENNRWEKYYGNLLSFKQCLIPISHRVKQDFEAYHSIGALVDIAPDHIDQLFSFARIMPRIRYNSLRVEDNNIDSLLTWLSSFEMAGAVGIAALKMIDLIRQSKTHSILYIDYQNICG